MSAHGMAKNSLPVHAQRKLRRNQRRQILHDVAVHPVVDVIGRFGGIDIKTGTAAKLPIIRLVRHICTAWTGIRTDHGDAKRGSRTAIFALFHDIGMGAGQP